MPCVIHPPHYFRSARPRRRLNLVLPGLSVQKNPLNSACTAQARAPLNGTKPTQTPSPPPPRTILCSSRTSSRVRRSRCSTVFPAPASRSTPLDPFPTNQEGRPPVSWGTSRSTLPLLCLFCLSLVALFVRLATTDGRHRDPREPLEKTRHVVWWLW